MAARHAASCNLCTDARFLDVFKTVAIHVKALRASTDGMPSEEASDFIAAHLHAATMRTLISYQEKFNELVALVTKVEAVMTADQQTELERLKAFARSIC